jgi:hypothetical protein
MADRAKAMAVTENLMTAHSDLAGLYADNESSLAGAVQALKSRGAKQVKLVGMDASEQLVADMRAGWIDSLVIQNPFRMGYESTRAVGLKLPVAALARLLLDEQDRLAFGGDVLIYVLDRLHNALAHIALGFGVAKLQRLALAGGRPGRDRRPSQRAALQ